MSLSQLGFGDDTAGDAGVIRGEEEEGRLMS